METTWHWEETNCTQWLTHKYHQLFSKFHWVSPNVTVDLVDPIIDGSASVLLRRGKPVASCCFNVCVDWIAVNASDLATVSGKMKFGDIDVESLEDPIYVQVTCATDDSLHRKVKTIILDEIVNALTERIRQDVLMPFVKEESVRVCEAQQQRAQTNQQPLQAAAASASAPSSAATQRGGDSLPLSAAVSDAAATPCKGESSSNGGPVEPARREQERYFWEEQNLTSSAIAELRRRLEKISNNNNSAAAIHCMGGECRLDLFDVQVSGEAVRSLRKEKRFPIYEFQVKCSWRATTRSASGVFLADAKGQLKVANFSSEEIDELSIDCECDDRSHPARDRIYSAIKTEGVDCVKEILLKFVQDLTLA